ncbi:MAG: hypothetical protein HZA31_13150 [Opitutae bacterium]|nr:hypothetical protein [Opitutae bacterium]
MIVIRRMVDRHQAYTAVFLPGEPAKIFPTSDQEHARILQIYKQDRPYADVLNDFADYGLGGEAGPVGAATPGRALGGGGHALSNRPSPAT